MKIMKLLLIGLVFLVSVSMTYAVPEIAYTNFARTAGGGLVLNSTVDVRITIFNSGTQVYQEIHAAVPTNGYGLFTVKLGTGAPVGADTYDAIVAVNTLNVQAETDNGGGYRFVQISPLLNTALKNEEAAGIVTLNDAYMNGDTIEVLPGAPLALTGTGLIQSDATIAAINANGNKTLTTKGYVDAADALISSNPFLVWEAAGADLPNSKILNGEADVINFNATTATLSILNNGISEPKLKMANDPSNGYIIKWNGTDMTWVDPTVITAHPVVGDGTVGSPITLYKTGVNANEVLYFNGTQWTNGQVTSAMIADGTIINGDINNATEYVNVTGEAGTPFDVTNGNLVLDFQGTGSTTVTLNQATHTVYIEAGIVADIPLSGAGTAADHLKINYDATLDLNGNNLSINTNNENTWTADQLLNATATQGNNLVAAVNMATDKTLEADVLMYDATLEVNTNELGFNHEHKNTWLTTQSFIPTANETALLVDGTNSTSGYALRAIGSGVLDNITDFYYEGDSYQEGFALINNVSTTKTTFGLQAVAQGQAATIPGFPTVAQGLTGVGQYTGAAPSTNMAIGSVGLAYAGNGVIAIGTYGGARDNNLVANVGTVGHAVTDASGNNHGIFGMSSLSASGTVEIGTALALGINSGVTGINLGLNANDWAGYFIGNVNVSKNLKVNSLNVTTTASVGTDLTVGGNATITGTTTSALFVGKLDKSVTGGAGLADLTFDNTADVAFAVNVAAPVILSGDNVTLDFDATLDLNVDKLSINTNNENTWTADQLLNATATQGNNLVDAANMATNQRLNGDVVNYDATLEVTANELGLDLDHSNSWTVNQTFALVDINGGSIDGTTVGANVPATGKFTTLESVTTTKVGTDLTVLGLTTTNTLDVTVDAVVGNDLAVVNDLGVGNNAEIGNNLDVLATTHSNEFKTTNDYFVVGEALNTAYVNVWDGSVAVLEMGRGAGLGSNYGIKLNDNAGGGTRAGIGHNGAAWVAGVGDLANANGVMMTWNSNVANETRLLVANGNLATPVFKIDAEGDVFATTYTGQLIHNVTGGAGLANLTFDNTADVAFAVNVAAPVIISADNVTLDFDATLDLNAGKLSINTANENTWTADQLLNATATQGNNLVAAINLANNQSLNGDVVNYDATLEVNANELGLDLDHENIWTVKQSFNESSSTNFFGTPILEVTGGASFTGQANDADLDISSLTFMDGVDFMFDGDAIIMGDVLAFSDFIVQENLNVKGIISGETNFDIQDGAGIADFTFNNTGDAIVAVDYDATLDLNVDQLSINTGHENTWTVDQNFSTIYANEYKTTNSYLVVGEVLNTAYANVWDNGVAVLEMGRGAGLGSNYGIRLNDNAGGGTRAGIGYNGAAWVTGVGDLTNQRGAMMSWNSNTANESRIIVANGNLASPVFSVDAEGDVRATSLRIDNYVYPTTAGAATEFMALKAPAMLGAPYELEWWNYDSTIVVDPLAKTIGLNQNAAFNFTNIVAFNPASGSAISATSSDPSAPTVTIEHTDPLGVALELVGAEGQTTALEVTTGGINVANGQFIVSSNAGVTGAEPNGPSITVNNNGDGVSENGGALQILVGHTSFSYGSYAPASSGAAVNLSGEPYTVLDVTSLGNNVVTLPGIDMAADVLGTIIYVINSGAGTLTLPGTLGNVNAGTSAQLVYTANGWFKLN